MRNTLLIKFSFMSKIKKHYPLLTFQKQPSSLNKKYILFDEKDITSNLLETFLDFVLILIRNLKRNLRVKYQTNYSDKAKE